MDREGTQHKCQLLDTQRFQPQRTNTNTFSPVKLLSQGAGCASLPVWEQHSQKCGGRCPELLLSHCTCTPGFVRLLNTVSVTPHPPMEAMFRDSLSCQGTELSPPRGITHCEGRATNPISLSPHQGRCQIM